MKKFSTNDYEGFSEQCKELGIGLHRYVDNAARYGWFQGYDLSQYGFYGAIAAAGELLGRKPRTKLAKRRIDESEALNRADEGDFARGVLVKIVNATLDRAQDMPADQRFKSSRQKRIVGVCPDAELYFANAIVQMKQPDIPLDSKQTKPVGYQIVTDQNGGPLAVRKSEGEPSTLTLADVSINNIPYPAGSIVQMWLKQDHARYTRQQLNATERSAMVPYGEHSSVDRSAVSGIRFNRISAFALQASQRTGAFGECFENLKSANEAAIDVLQSATIDEIAGIAKTALHSAALLPPTKPR